MKFISQFYADCRSFPTGFGSRDSKKDRAYKTISLNQIISLLENPYKSPKEEAPWFIPSNYFGPWARSHEVQLECGRFTCLTIDIDEASPAMFDVIGACEAIFGNVHMIVYSSASASLENLKWRVLLPFETPLNGYEWRIAQTELFDAMASEGIICDRALSRTGQLVYLPNVPPDKRDAAGRPLFYEKRKCVGVRYARG